MDIYALFDDGTANRIIISFFDSDPGCRIKIDFPSSLSDAQIRNSADEGIHCAYQSLRSLNYIAEREDFYLRCRFEDTDVNTKVLGASAGLGFSLKFVQEIYQEKTGKSLKFSVAATGIIDETGCKVKRVYGINKKFDAAIDCLQQGDKFIYPAENDKEIDSDKRERALKKGIVLVPVLTVEDAINRLLPLETFKAGYSPKKLFFYATILFILLVVGLVPDTRKIIIDIIIPPHPPSSCETDAFIYKKEYEAAQQQYLTYLADKQRFDDLQLFVKSVSGVQVPIHPVRLYVANQPELAAIVEAVREGKTYPHNRANKIVLIAGGPGAGKSLFLKWLACRSEDPEYSPIAGKIAILDLGRSFRAKNRIDDPQCRHDPIPADYTTLEEDLTIDGIDISNLPKIDTGLLESDGNATKTLQNILYHFGFAYEDDCDKTKVTSKMKLTTIIVDSIDEVSPASSKKLLELLAAYKQENPAMTIIAAGRGEGFREYAITNIGSYEYHHLEPIYLSTERLIEWRIRDWLIYALIVSEDAKDISRADVTLSDLRSVEFEKEVKKLKHWTDEALKKDPWLRNFLFMLLPSNKLFSNLYLHPVSDQSTQPTKNIRETWVSSYLLRSCNTHNRPKSFSDSIRLNIYESALQQVARNARVAFGNVPSGPFSPSLSIKMPYFILTNRDDVGVALNDETQSCTKVSIIRALERSGFVDIFLVGEEQHHVMFFPPVAQEILAEF